MVFILSHINTPVGVIAASSVMPIIVVVTGAEEVEVGKDIVDVAAVSEGVVLAECACHASGGAENIAPCVIGVFYHEIAGAVYR